MKIAVITDLHANREAVQAVLDHAQARGAEQHAFVGDFVGYGADPAWVVDKVRELVRGGAWAVQGNHDAAVADLPGPHMRPDARRVVEWTQAQLDAAQRDFLAGLPLTQEHDDLLFVHASAAEPAAWAYVHGRVEAAQSLLATARRITFCGHMHEPRLYHLSAVGRTGDFVPVPGVPIPLLGSRRWLAIPGSSGQPRDGDPAACYALYDSACSELVYWRVPYDVERAAAKIRAAELPPVLARRLLDGH
jgi:diadenosine tetraphosphatase ApaH/serine/threonine PP2A family protein phosphatase